MSGAVPGHAGPGLKREKFSMLNLPIREYICVEIVCQILLICKLWKYVYIMVFCPSARTKFSEEFQLAVVFNQFVFRFPFDFGFGKYC
jgi:hypothetical protein